ncbi:MAG: sigma-70 family RNA polymerase sigma factor [Kiritimatiellae bacterium]|nr:sigma-70 family RNA polymerase sigma factor [Kiritimatiellia bacterium]
MSVPATSITLLKDLSTGAESVRWAEFVRLYEEPMRGYLRRRFPSADEDDVLQETLIALTKRMPGYHYTPDRNGHFRNYLTGILRHKAEDALRRQAREAGKRERMRAKIAADATRPGDGDDETWKYDAMHAALEQLLSDASVSARLREVFRHLVVLHERPRDVADAFGLTRRNVDLIKHRLVRRLQSLVDAMTAPD